MTALLWLLLSAAAWADNKEDFLAAREALQKGNLTEVAARAEALSRDPLGIYPRYWLLSRQIEQLAPEQILPFLNFYQGSWLAEKLRNEWLLVLGKRGDWERFREQYRLLVDEPGTEQLCYHLQSRLAAGDKDKEVLAHARAVLWFTHKDLPALACGPLIEKLLATGIVSEDDLWARLRLAFENGAQGLARSLAPRLGQELPAKALDTAINNPTTWLKKPTGSGRMRQELAILAIARLGRSNVDAAHEQLLAWQDRLGADAEPYAWRRLATVAAFRHDPRAEEWYRKSSKQAWTDYSAEWRIRLALRLSDWETVLSTLKLLSDEKQKERPWQYWKARALEATGAPAGEPNRIYALLSVDDDYYGLLARDRLGPTVGPASAIYKVTDEDWRRIEANAGLKRALLLNAMNLRTEAVREWNWGLRGADDRLLLAAAEAAREAAWYDRAIYAAERTKALHNYELRYMAPYRELTREYAGQVGLDEAWVYGLMRQESRFVSSARSGVGAGGLMQLMPATARWVAGKVGLRYEPAMVNDAGVNVRLGTYYLKHVLDNLSSQPVLATAGYNAGPNRARDWQMADKPLEAALYIESIPYLETRDYVKKVMTNAVHYAMTFGHPRQSLTARIGTIPPRNPVAVEGP
ncbi:MAG: lytic transglycosylase catalytic subunit [Moraxellaceae bacterium]|jgi:soluble lytic murein transglycosylase|nr:lytic transglycosylase catalytic subunit [Moraxellaceae bacterium]